MERVLSKKHPSTLASMNNLVGALRGQGKYGQADEHTFALMSMNNGALG